MPVSPHPSKDHDLTRSLNCPATFAVLFLFACTDDRQPLGPDSTDNGKITVAAATRGAWLDCHYDELGHPAHRLAPRRARRRDADVQRRGRAPGPYRLAGQEQLGDEPVCGSATAPVWLGGIQGSGDGPFGNLGWSTGGPATYANRAAGFDTTLNDHTRGLLEAPGGLWFQGVTSFIADGYVVQYDAAAP